MTDSHERIISADELHRVTLVCELCHAELTIDLKSREQVQVFKLSDPHVIADFKCAMCGTQFRSELRAAFKSFLGFLDWADRSGDAAVKAFFRIAER